MQILSPSRLLRTRTPERITEKYYCKDKIKDNSWQCLVDEVIFRC